MMKKNSLILASSLWLAVSAHAGMFDDEEARRAILDLRSKFELSQKLNTSTQQNLNQKIEQLDAQIVELQKASAHNNVAKSLLDLANQIEQLKSDIAKLRGQNEVLANDINNLQKRQKDFYTDLDARLRKLEPSPTTVDGREVVVDPNEQRQYEAAFALFKANNFKDSVPAFSEFTKRHPQSAYAASAWYWLGTSYFALNNFAAAIAAQQTVASNFADSPRAPDAMINLAASQVELKDKKGAKTTLDNLIAKYPNSAAAQLARERVATLK